TARLGGNPRPISTGRFAAATVVQLVVAAGSGLYAALNQDSLREIAMMEALFVLVCLPLAVFLQLPKGDGR
ncbi:hypothetical protein ACFQ07_10965, partial [Actinomadura adrarensis]